MPLTTFFGYLSSFFFLTGYQKKRRSLLILYVQWLRFTHSEEEPVSSSTSETRKLELSTQSLGKFFKLISEPEVGSQENISISGSWSSPGLPFSQVVWKEQGFINRKPRAWDSLPYELFWKHLKPSGNHISLRNVVLWILREYEFILDLRVAGHE